MRYQAGSGKMHMTNADTAWYCIKRYQARVSGSIKRYQALSSGISIMKTALF